MNETLSRTREDYRKYLESDHWRLLRAAAFRKLGRKCSRCPAKFGLQVHHTRYRWPWTSCTTDDLIILCRSCHVAEHAVTIEQPAPRLTKKQRKRSRAERRRQERALFRHVPRRRRKHKPPKDKRWKTKIWWPGMYEGKAPGEVTKEIGTNAPQSDSGNKTPNCMNPKINRRASVDWI